MLFIQEIRMSLVTKVFAMRSDLDATITEHLVRRRLSHFARIHCFIVLSLIVSGCGAKGREISEVTANFTLDGKPLADGRVCVVSASGFGAAAQLGPDGQVHLVSQHGAGIPTGEYKVTVGPHFDARKILETMPSTDPNRSPSAAERPAAASIPKKYWFPNTTDLTATVTAERHHFTFALQSSAQEP
jgi:hypothetical protein